MIILIGLIVSFYPSFIQIFGKFDYKKNNDYYTEHNETKKQEEKSYGTFFWNFIFVLGSVPTSLASVYQEKTFSEQVFK